MMTLFEQDSNENGVRPRRDKKGTKFGEAHRHLPIDCLMTDLDVMTAVIKAKIFVQQNFSDKLYIEARMFDWAEAVVYFPAIIELKNSLNDFVFQEIENIGNCSKNKPKRTGEGTSLWLHMQHAKRLTHSQQMDGLPACRCLIFALEWGKSPMTIFEINTNTGERQIPAIIPFTEENFTEKLKECYHKIGLL